MESGGKSDAATGHNLSLASKKLRESCQNGLVVSVFMSSDVMNERLVRCILATSAVVKDWHANMSRSFRTCEGSFEWLLQERVHGKFMVHVNTIMGRLSFLAAMESCRFVCTIEADVLFAVAVWLCCCCCPWLGCDSFIV